MAVASEGGLRLIALAFVAGAAITALCGLLGFSGGPVNSLPGQSRVQGGAGDPNVLAAAVLAAAALAGGLLPGTRRPGARLLLMAAIVVFGLTLAGTESRGGAIAAVVVLGRRPAGDAPPPRRRLRPARSGRWWRRPRGSSPRRRASSG